MRAWQRLAPRPWWRSLADGLVMLALVWAIGFGLRVARLLPQETGAFTAIDGDSLRKDGHDYRLHAIDAPELFQTCTGADGSDYPCGRMAREALRRLVGNGPVTCQVLDTDRYGRSVAECSAGSVNLSDAMVRAGWAVAYTSHGLDHVAAEQAARAAHRGIWQGSFEMPEAWRRARRNGQLPAD